LRPVREHVPEVAAAVRAQHLGADHPVTDVTVLVDRVFVRRGVERGPAAARVVLRLRLEDGCTAAGALIRARLEGVVVFAAERALGALLAENPVLLGREGCPPLLFGLLDLTHGANGTNGG